MTSLLAGLGDEGMTWTRVFVWLSVLMVALVYARISSTRTLRKLNTPHSRTSNKSSSRTVVLTGPLAAGKTALFSTVSSIADSQVESPLSRGRTSHGT